MELQIDTSTRYACVGLSSEGETLVEIAWRSERNHSIELVPAINRALDHAGASIADLTAVFVASGPGGFSALRVGMSTAKSIAYTRSIPLVTVGTLELEIHPFAGLSRPVCATMSGGRNRLYIGVRAPGESKARVSLQDVSDFYEELSSDTFYCGEAIPDLRDEMMDRLGNAASLSAALPPSRHASSLAYLGYAKLLSGGASEPVAATPTYLRSSQVASAHRRWRQTAAT